MEFKVSKSMKRIAASVAMAAVITSQSLVAAAADSGVVKVKSNASVAQTVERLTTVLQAKGMTVFTTIDHAKGAEKAGLALPPTQVVIFGNPKIGTLLMQCAGQSAIDLPQKALIQQDSKGDVWLSYNAPSYIAGRHGIKGCDKVIGKVSQALANFAKAATQG